MAPKDNGPGAVASAEAGDLFGGEPEQPQHNAAPTVPQDDGGGYWWSRHDDLVVIEEQPRTAIYWNGRGQLVLRQESSPLEDDDPFIVLSVEFVERLIDVLRAELEEARRR